MTFGSDINREEQALDGLIVAAYRQDRDADDSIFDLNCPEPVLSDDDCRALAALGADLVARIVGGWQRDAELHEVESRAEEPEILVAGAMHRGNPEGDLTDVAREEIERRIRELQVLGTGSAAHGGQDQNDSRDRRPKDAAEIEHEAEVISEAHGLRSFPIDPFAIAKLERIVLVPGDFDGCFDGRIEYRRHAGEGHFYLFYAQEETPDRPPGRVRFSVAHELGHFYLPEHREYLTRGVSHGSTSGFVSDKVIEREADLFAASLLMPRREFKRRVGMKSRSVCTLRDLVALADDIFQTSLTSTAIRYAQLNFEPCSVILSRDGRVLFSVRSDDMRRPGLGWLQKDSRIPGGSVTGRTHVALADGKIGESEGAVDSDVWFESDQAVPLWEEVKVLGRTGLTLTFLVVNEDENE